MLVFAVSARAKTEFFNVDDVRPGMKGYGFSVFKGVEIERFEMEILGVMKKSNAGQDLVLARLSGQGLEHSGVIAGMSGSPVYIDDKLLGAVAYAWSFQKDPIAGITLITDMARSLNDKESADAAAPGAGIPGVVADAQPAGRSAPTPIPTPVMLGGFSARGAAKISGFLKSRGLEPMPMGAAAATDHDPRADDLQPGSAIAVPLLSGDFSAAAIGTVTYREGDKVLAFGHPFLNTGPSDMPIAGGVIHTVMAGWALSFKMGSPTSVVGRLVSDRLSAIMGRYGDAPDMVPLVITINDPDSGEILTFNAEVIQNEIFTVPLLYGAAFEAIARSLGDTGEGTVKITVDGKFREIPEPFHFEDVDYHVMSAMSVDVFEHLVRIVYNGFKKIHLESARVDIRAERKIRYASIQGVAVSGRRFRPGDEVGLAVRLLYYDGEEAVRNLKFRIPGDAPTGPLALTIEGGEMLGPPEQAPPVTFEQYYARALKWTPGNTISVKLTLPGSAPAIYGEEYPRLPGSIQGVIIDGAAAQLQPVPAVIQQLYAADEVIGGGAQAQIMIQKEYGQ